MWSEPLAAELSKIHFQSNSRWWTLPKLEMWYCFGIFRAFLLQDIILVAITAVGNCWAGCTLFVIAAVQQLPLSWPKWCSIWRNSPSAMSYLVFDMLAICQFLCICILHNCVVCYVTCALFAVALQMLLRSHISCIIGKRFRRDRECTAVLLNIVQRHDVWCWWFLCTIVKSAHRHYEGNWLTSSNAWSYDNHQVVLSTEIAYGQVPVIKAKNLTEHVQ